MASELVPGNFFVIEVNESFSLIFRKDHKRLFGTSGKLLIH